MPRTSWSVPAVAQEVAAARRAVVAYARAQGVPEARLHDVALAVSEAVTNAAIHAFRDGRCPGTVTLAVEVLAGAHVEVVVRDDGMGLTPRTDSPGLGFGLSLIQHSADQVERRRPSTGGFEVWMRFRFDRPRAAARTSTSSSSARSMREGPS